MREITSRLFYPYFYCYGIIRQPTPLRRTEIDPLNRGKLTMLTKELNNSNIGYFLEIISSDGDESVYSDE
jgi:hypothetical protein